MRLREALPLALLAAAGPALAFDPFEIQIYDGTADARGQPGLEAHLNSGIDTLHLTLEPSFGVTAFWEIGGYLQTALVSGEWRYQGVKLRSKFVLPAREHLRLGMNFEVSREPGGWGGEIRPILGWDGDRWLLVANPNITFPLAFEPGAMAKLKLGPVAVGVEYYGTLPHEHYLFEAVDLLSVKEFELNAGLGEGLTGESTKLIFKVIIGYAF